MTDPSQTAFMGPTSPPPSTNTPRQWLLAIVLSVLFVVLALGYFFYGLYQNRQAETTWQTVFEWAGCSAAEAAALKGGGTLEPAQLIQLQALRQQLENRQRHLNLAMAQWQESQIRRKVFVRRIQEIKAEVEQLEAGHPYGDCIQKCR